MTKDMAVIIKHPYRDFDYRVDVYTVDENTTNQELYEYVMSQMLGPFEVIAITEKLSQGCSIKTKTKVI